jgi:hypothetical protein
MPIGFVLFQMVCQIFQEPSGWRFQTVNALPSSRIRPLPETGTTAIMYPEISTA